MTSFIITFINVVYYVATLLILGHVLLSYFLDPYHPLRQTIARILEPLLSPIRQFMPQTGMIDFSPMILLFILWGLRALVVRLLAG